VLGQAFAMSNPVAPRTPLKLRGCTPGKFGGVVVPLGVEVVSAQNVPNVACWAEKTKICTAEVRKKITTRVVNTNKTNTMEQGTDILQIVT
jgi:hypothetical protein